MEELNESKQIAIGEQLANVLYLKIDPKYRKNDDVRYLTSWGNKTALGLYLSVKRIIEDKG